MSSNESNEWKKAIEAKIKALKENLEENLEVYKKTGRL